MPTDDQFRIIDRRADEAVAVVTFLAVATGLVLPPQFAGMIAYRLTLTDVDVYFLADDERHDIATLAGDAAFAQMLRIIDDNR